MHFWGSLLRWQNPITMFTWGIWMCVLKLAAFSVCWSKGWTSWRCHEWKRDQWNVWPTYTGPSKLYWLFTDKIALLLSILKSHFPLGQTSTMLLSLRRSEAAASLCWQGENHGWCGNTWRCWRRKTLIVPWKWRVTRKQTGFSQQK